MKFDFLNCSERSGSNLITKLIDNHSQYCGPGPIHLIRTFDDKMKDYGDLSIDLNWNIFITDVIELFKSKIAVWNTDISFNELLKLNNRSLGNVLKYIYAKEIASFNKERAFVKEIHTYNNYSFLINNFDSPKFIWLVRDPRDMALSWCKSPIHRGDVIRASNIWSNDQKKSRQLYEKEAGVKLVKYEELITDQKKVLKDICDFLEVKYEDGMGNFYRNEISQLNSKQSDNWKNLNKSIISTNHKKYKTKLTKEQIQYIEYVCKEEMHFLGYDLDYKEISESEFLEINKSLLKVERNEKEEYLLVPEEERYKRQVWQNKYLEIINKSLV